ncbi:Uncharacterised protein [Vibrio cholerae]|nr:Uncharacterised protein [Vibrio cholerae]
MAYCRDPYRHQCPRQKPSSFGERYRPQYPPEPWLPLRSVPKYLGSNLLGYPTHQ